MKLRRHVLWLALMPFAEGARAGGALASKPGETQGSARLKGLNIVLVVDAERGAEMRQVQFFTQSGGQYFAKSLVSRRTRTTFSLGQARVPEKIHAVWREGAGWDDVAKHWNEGTIVGDYTIPVASRIPDDVVADVRASGGDLRIKFRLQPTGVLFGWDIERNGAGTGRVFRYDMVGGDFLETDY